MALRTEYIDFEDERTRLMDRMEELAEKQAGFAEDSTRAQRLLIEGNALNNQRNILEHLAEEWGVDGVELAGLTAGEVNRVEDTVENNPQVRERDAWVAVGTHDAPYLDHDPENIVQDAYEQTVVNVTDLPLPYVRWAEAKISDLSHLGADEGNGYLALVRDKRGET